MAKLKARFASPEVVHPAARMRAGTDSAVECQRLADTLSNLETQQHQVRGAIGEQARMIGDFRAWIRGFQGALACGGEAA